MLLQRFFRISIRAVNTNALKSCSGCGAFFQNHSITAPGYLPPIAMRRDKEEYDALVTFLREKVEPLTPSELNILLGKDRKDAVITCLRCHAIQKSGRAVTTSLKTNRAQFAALKMNKGGLVFVVLDLMDLKGTIIPDLVDYVGAKDTVVLLNKSDVMPNNYAWKTIKTYISTIYPYSLGVIPISSKNGAGISQFMELIAGSFKKNEDCYLVGCTNVGKSSLMNVLKKRIGQKEMITTSSGSGTTAGLIKLGSTALRPILQRIPSHSAATEEEEKDEKFVIDTAGIIGENQLCHEYSAKDLKYILSKGPLLMNRLVRKDRESFWLGGVVRVDIYMEDPSLVSEFNIVHSTTITILPCKLGKVPQTRTIATRPNVLFPDEDTKLDLAGRYSSARNNTIWISGVGWFETKGDFQFEIFTANGRGVTISSNVTPIDHRRRV